jgi:Cobalamin-independent synthase, N-terminal domain
LVSRASVRTHFVWPGGPELRSKIRCILGGNREVKKAVEAYWAGKISADDLAKAAAAVRKASWESLKAQHVDFIPRLAFSRRASIHELNDSNVCLQWRIHSL